MDNKEIAKILAEHTKNIGELKLSLAGITLLLANRVSDFEPAEKELLKTESDKLKKSAEFQIAESESLLKKLG